MSKTVEFTVRIEAGPERPVVLAPAEQVAEAFLDALEGVFFEVNGTRYEIWNAAVVHQGADE